MVARAAFALFLITMGVAIGIAIDQGIQVMGERDTAIWFATAMLSTLGLRWISTANEKTDRSDENKNERTDAVGPDRTVREP